MPARLPQPAWETTGRLLSIDLLRGSAALAVAIDHAIRHGKLPGDAWFHAIYAVLSWGHLGVPLFFVISGFCIHLRWAKRYAESGREDVRFVEFWKRRVWRLYPPYVTTLTLSMGLVVGAYLTAQAPFLLVPYPDPKPRWLTLDLFAHVTMLHGFHPILDRTGGNPPFWTLAREEYLYLMYFPLLFWRRWWGVATSALIVLGLSLTVPAVILFFLPPLSLWRDLVETSAVALWIQWCLGMVAGEAHCGLIRLPQWCRSGRLIPLWTAVAMLSESYFRPLSAVLWGMTFFTLVNWTVSIEKERRWPGRSCLRWLSSVGLFSYSLYLVHTPVQVVAESVSRRLLAVVGVIEGPYAYLLRATILVAASYAAAKVFFALVERHFVRPRPR